jgi:hypothetical protein
MEWIESKTTNVVVGGGKKSSAENVLKRTMRRKTRTKKQKGGKWSLKYKKSINCKRPKGFSQKQHCKYGRKNK